MGVASIGSDRLIHRLCLAGSSRASDVGRRSDGQLLWVEAPERDESGDEREVTMPRFFDPMVTLRSDSETLPITEPQESPVAQTLTKIRVYGKFLRPMRRLLTRRRMILGATVLIAGVGLTLLWPTRSAPVNPVPTSSSTAGGSSSQETTTVSDPLKASIDFAIAGELPALGQVQGLPRNSFTATITNRSGDFVLIDVYVTKPSGEKTFATVLLQKTGTQWRMREVFDARG
ncbi:MAG: hypothetical protein RIR88_926 [Actinomycetota bacterium]